MNTNNLLWVLGHKIRLLDTDESYGMVEITSPPHVGFVELPPNTTHTFINNTEQDVVWVTGWRPKGFERFFRDFGIPVQESLAQERSVADQVVRKVLKNVERYGMYLAD